MAEYDDTLTGYSAQHSRLLAPGGVAPIYGMHMPGIPGLDGPMGMLAQMILQPYIGQLMGQVGSIPGQFSPTQNLMDFSRGRDFLKQHQQAMGQAAKADEDSYFNTFRGIANLAGTPWGEEQIKATRRMSKDIIAMAPILASMMPETFDELHGPRGSAAVMSHYLHMGGRYSIDPVSGLTGMSAQSAGAMTQRVYESLYGKNADITEMKGIGAGRAGQLYDELQRRGYMGSSTKPMSAKDREEMLESPMLQDKARAVDADKISSRLKEMSGVVAAMRDIFGDLGKPNAPMSELINGLQALTQGGLSTMDATKLETTARTLHNVARNSGMGMNGMMQLMAIGAGQADQMDLDRAFVRNTALQSAAFGQAYSSTGQGDVTYFGSKDKEAIIVLDQKLRLNAANSPLAAQFATATILADETKVGGEFGEYAKAIKEGKTTFGENGRSVLMSNNQLQALYVKSGGTDAVYNSVRGNTAYQKEYIEKYQLQNPVRALQGDIDFKARIYDSVLPLVSSNTTTANTVTDLVREMSQSDFADKKIRNDAVAEALWKANDNKGKKSDYLGQAVQIWSGLEHRFSTDKRGQNLGTEKRLHDSATLREGAEVVVESQTEAAMQTAMSGFGRSGPLRRLMGELQKAGPNADFEKLAAAALGGVSIDEITKLKSPLMDLANKQQEFYSTRDPRKRNKLLQEITALSGNSDLKSRVAPLITDIDRFDPFERSKKVEEIKPALGMFGSAGAAPILAGKLDTLPIAFNLAENALGLSKGTLFKAAENRYKEVSAAEKKGAGKTGKMDIELRGIVKLVGDKLQFIDVKGTNTTPIPNSWE